MKLEFPPFLGLGENDTLIGCPGADTVAATANVGQKEQFDPLAADRTSEDTISALITSTIKEILMVECATPCSELMLGRLKELLFVELVRRLGAPPPSSAEGRLGKRNDPIVARALRFVHGDPGRRWTVADLAREAGCSRSVLAERFSTVLGQAPIEYLTGWRMQIAGERIRSSSDSLAAIVADAGYKSHAAFHRAFKRVMGVTPGRWRDGAAASPSQQP